MMEEKGLIFDIQGYSVHDGPGCRTLVFLKGCPLDCAWCSNPEGKLFKPEIMYRATKCTYLTQGCERCITACPEGAIQKNLSGNGDQEIAPLVLDRSKCQHCRDLDCVALCYFEALKVCGRWYSVSELMRVLKRDQQYWGGMGGVTFSGGEPLMQRRFMRAVLEACRDAYIHIAVETSAYIEPGAFLELMRFVDWAFIDIKHMDPEKHRAGTGVSNELILSNIALLARSGWSGRLIIRMPVIPGFNDDDENILKTAEFLREVGLVEMNILPFHRLGDSKWTQLGAVYPYRDYEGTPEEKMAHLQKLLLDQQIACYVGSETPF
ncbi:MFS transporter [Thermanaerothrix daxensis]|uniref:MFS transporter n=2 Tax=Thermanaerothrix daxensis TaxID=869279 RepID=A0A0P6XHV3_9CHLR|nr:MFS transporter [Thermanaerothrix daxensis]